MVYLCIWRAGSNRAHGAIVPVPASAHVCSAFKRIGLNMRTPTPSRTGVLIMPECPGYWLPDYMRVGMCFCVLHLALCKGRGSDLLYQRLPCA